jgi:hypothetical protein
MRKTIAVFAALMLMPIVLATIGRAQAPQGHDWPAGGRTGARRSRF